MKITTINVNSIKGVFYFYFILWPKQNTIQIRKKINLAELFMACDCHGNQKCYLRHLKIKTKKN